MIDVYTKCTQLPARIRGFTRENPDGSYTILLNDDYSVEDRLATYRHELAHITGRDFEKDQEASCIETLAHKNSR
jgi:hypothetical protein